MIQAKLFVLKQEIDLLWTQMRYHRDVRPNTRPKSEVQGGLFTVCFESKSDTDLLLRWMTKESRYDDFNEIDKMEKGEVCFYEDGVDLPPTKMYKFNDAYLVNFVETFDAQSDTQVQTVMTISPAIQDYGAELIKPWNVSHIGPSEDEPYQPMEETKLEKKITDIFYEDMDGNKVRDLKVGMEVYLVIKSENVAGSTVNVNLSDKNNDFLHEGELLENDMLRDLQITGGVHKEKLKIVAEHHGTPSNDDPAPEEENPQGENQEETGTTPIVDSNEEETVEGEKKLVEYFLTDVNGTRVEEYEVGDKIVLNIKTENRVGDNITIHLEDKTHDFRYNGEVLEDDILSDYTITKDEEKIELEVIAQSTQN